MKDLSIRVLPALAIAEGATTPDPGGKAWVWSTTLGAPVFWDGTRWRGVVAISVGVTAPANPAVGNIWIDSN